MKKLWQIFDDYISSIYFEKDYRNYYMRGGNIVFFINLPLLLIHQLIKFSITFFSATKRD